MTRTPLEKGQFENNPHEKRSSLLFVATTYKAMENGEPPWCLAFSIKSKEINYLENLNYNLHDWPLELGPKLIIEFLWSEFWRFSIIIKY